MTPCVQDDDEPDSGTMIHAPANDRTLVPTQDFDNGTMILSRTSEVTMFEQCTGKLVPHGRSGRQMSDYEGLTDEKEAYSTDSREDANSTIFRN